ncbi:aldo/keto reductase [Streptosporangium sp. NPDC051023]|uniref:aldo/keto reductase n=1 Tax=Streptosporangium sp. NPDC051023 TaxID=3155410 RepID=UPI0034502926
MTMEYRVLGRTGLKVSKICLGAMMFGSWGTSDQGDVSKIIGTALDAGVNFIDTSDNYSGGESEQLVGKALADAGVRDRVVLATKCHMPMGEDPNSRGNSRRWIFQEVENSLRRLGTDWIDLYQIHRPDLTTDIDETLGALTDLVRAGKIRYFGTSTFPAHLLVEAHWTSQVRARERFVCEQAPYSLLVRGVEADVLPVCEKLGTGVITWSPLAGGWLSGTYRKDKEQPFTIRSFVLPERYDMALTENQRKLEAVEAFAELAEKTGITLIELSLAFVLQHPAVTSVIIGPRTAEHLASQLTSASVTLDAEVLDEIDRIVPPGVTLNPHDAGWRHPALEEQARRRR